MEPRSHEDVGRICLLSELKEKDVISLADGKRLGKIADAEIDLDERRITAVLLSQASGRTMFFEQAEQWRIPWEMIDRIGEDVVLVKAAMMNRKKESRGIRLFGRKE